MTTTKRTTTPERLEQILESTYPDISCRVDGDALSIFEMFPEGKNGLAIANYYAEGEDYEIGIAVHFQRWAERKGYWVEWQNPEHIKLWKD